MKRFTTLTAAVAVAAPLLLGACTQPTTPPTTTAAPTAPATISGPGRYDYNVLYQGNPNFVGGDTATVNLTRNGSGTYTGTVLTDNGGPQGYFEIGTSGHNLTSLYTRDVNDPGATGFVLSTTAVDATAITGGACTGAGLEITFSGAYSAPNQDFGGDATVTVCDPAAAAWFG